TGVTPTASGGTVAWNITPGTVLVVDRGTRNEEWIQVVDILPDPTMPNPNPGVYTTAFIQAVFLRSHGDNTATNTYDGNFRITQPGNPGPQPPLDVRNYFHAPVVPVAVTIEPGQVKP